jgi:TRAP-type mannitol/chloroaromatic compound transport system substrate-binding protein
MGGWFTKEVTGVGSYAALRYRMPGLGGEVLHGVSAPSSSIFREAKSRLP